MESEDPMALLVLLRVGLHRLYGILVMLVGMH